MYKHTYELLIYICLSRSHYELIKSQSMMVAGALLVAVDGELVVATVIEEAVAVGADRLDAISVAVVDSCDDEDEGITDCIFDDDNCPADDIDDDDVGALIATFCDCSDGCCAAGGEDDDDVIGVVAAGAAARDEPSISFVDMSGRLSMALAKPLQSGAPSFVSTILKRSLSSSSSLLSGEVGLPSCNESIGINGGGATASAKLHSVGEDGLLEVMVDGCNVAEMGDTIELALMPPPLLLPLLVSSVLLETRICCGWIAGLVVCCACKVACGGTNCD